MSRATTNRRDGPWRLGLANRPHHAEGERDFDELVVGRWFHMERMDSRTWWVRIGSEAFDVTVRNNSSCKILRREA
jgi:hypothetical protein